VQLRELERAGEVRSAGERRGTRWTLVTDEDRIAQRVAELERSRAMPSAGGGSTGAWDDVLRATADAAAMLARYSELARGLSQADGERLSDLIR
jgi:hypothetical protein